jgi:hypothetical protein
MKRTTKYVGLDVHQATTVASVRDRSGIVVAGVRVYSAAHREEWLNRPPDRGARVRAELLVSQIDLLRELRPRAQAVMVREARRDPVYEVLRSIPFFGPIRVSLLMATMKTSWRFRTKRNLWPLPNSPS